MISKKLVFLGDSITEGFGDDLAIGWAGRLSQRLNAPGDETHWSVSNLGCGGDTILDGKHRLAPALLNYPTHIIMAFGTNDMAHVIWPDDTGSKLHLQYARQVWLQLLTHIKGLNIQIAVIGTLPVIESEFPFQFKPYAPDDRGYSFFNADQQAYNAMLKQVCTDHDVLMVDLFEDWMKRDLKTLLCDGLHPGTRGYDLLAEQIHSALQAGYFLS